jgi:alcohol dehydrogenase class IV
MTHAIAQAVGGVLHIPHGVGVAIGTPVNLKYNAAVCTDTYASLAEACSISGDSRESRAAAFVDRVIELLQTVGLPDRIPLPADAPDDLAIQLARNAIESTPVPLQLNPIAIDEPALVTLFEELLAR